MIFKKIFRFYVILFSYVGSKCRILKFKLKSNHVKITGSSFVEKNVTIDASNESKIMIVNSYISEGTHIKADLGGSIVIKDTFVGHNCIIVAIDKIEIDKNCQIAEFVVIRDQDHNHHLDDQPIAELGFSSKPVLIESNVWIGAKASILKGATIGKNAVIGAHSLVLGNVNAGSVHVGTPSREIKSVSH